MKFLKRLLKARLERKIKRHMIKYGYPLSEGNMKCYYKAGLYEL